MTPLDQFESDQVILDELKYLFMFVPPQKLRRNLEDLFFTYLTSQEDSCLPDQKELIKNLYYLINFLNEMESQERF